MIIQEQLFAPGGLERPCKAVSIKRAREPTGEILRIYWRPILFVDDIQFLTADFQLFHQFLDKLLVFARASPHHPAGTAHQISFSILDHEPLAKIL